MSIDALKYVKDVRVAPNGEPISLREKAILWYLANAHNEEKRCAYPSVKTIAASNNISERTVQEILKELIRKGVIWRREAYRENGSLTSNQYRFVAVDGEPTTQDLIAEDQRRIRGELMAEAARRKKSAEKSTEDCGNQREISHQAGAEDCATLARNPAPPSAETCATLARKPAPPGAETCATLARKPAPPELQTELPEKNQQNPQGSKLESSGELQAAGQTEESAFAQVWTLMLAELASAGAIPESDYLRACVETTQIGAYREGERIVLRIGVSEVQQVQFYADHFREFVWAAREVGLDPSRTRLLFEPMEKARRA